MAKLRYVSLFSGIEAVSCALDHDVWEPVAFSEIDPFPCAALAQHYPNVPNLGNITKIDWTPYVDTIDVVWGGSPCQSFSLAGDRSGLKGASGLMFEFIRAVREIRPRWFVWENVPGALSSENGNAFRQLLQSMDEGGYGLAWRVLDAQFFGVAQRRERVFLVGSLGTMRCAEVLFEREGVPWDYSQSRDKRKALAGKPSGRVGNADPRAGERLTVASDFHQQDARMRVSKQLDVSGTITAHAGTGGNNVPMVMCRADTQANASTGHDLTPTLMAHAKHDPPLIWRSPSTGATDIERTVDGVSVDNAMWQARQRQGSVDSGRVEHDTQHGQHADPVHRRGGDSVSDGLAVRRLTPTECERLQGFPDGWTDIPYKGKEHPPDSPRYKALGNSMAVPVMRWIGERIMIFDDRSK